MGDPHTIGLVLSGGGARGAYEVGVLSWIAEERPALLSAIRVVTGSSVGAINGTYLASHGMNPAAVAGLADLWRNLLFEDVLAFSSARLLKIMASATHRLWTKAASPSTGVFLSEGLQSLVRDQIDWVALQDRVARSELDAVAVAATEIGGGRTHIFVDHRPDLPVPRWPDDRSLIGITGTLKPEHVLASTSLPFLFSPVRIGDLWYTDGSVRQNTPLSTALRLGAERLVVISLGGPDTRVEQPGVFPGLGQLLGKLLNSIFLDRMLWDLDRLDRINDVLDAGTKLFGDDFLPRLQTELGRIGRRPYKRVPYVAIRPERDIGQLAARLLREPGRLRTALGRPMRSILSSDNMAAADGASYLLFDGAFAREVIDLGYEDAAQLADRFDGLMA